MDPKRQRTERLEARVTPEQKAQIEHAASLEGRSVTDFVLMAVRDAALRAIDEHQRLVLSVRDARLFVEALNAPPPLAPPIADLISKRGS
ncbi:MAG: DUF1778 domain-containing protein [Acidocella sp.]|nr:DUF1778 domain-containing protein [Acidocella sp.]